MCYLAMSQKLDSQLKVRCRKYVDAGRHFMNVYLVGPMFKRVSMKQRLQRHVSVVVERAGNRGHVVVDRLVPERLLGALSTECQHPVYVDDAR